MSFGDDDFNIDDLKIDANYLNKIRDSGEESKEVKSTEGHLGAGETVKDDTDHPNEAETKISDVEKEVVAKGTAFEKAPSTSAKTADAVLGQHKFLEKPPEKGRGLIYWLSLFFNWDTGEKGKPKIEDKNTKAMSNEIELLEEEVQELEGEKEDLERELHDVRTIDNVGFTAADKRAQKIGIKKDIKEIDRELANLRARQYDLKVKQYDIEELLGKNPSESTRSKGETELESQIQEVKDVYNDKIAVLNKEREGEIRIVGENITEIDKKIDEKGERIEHIEHITGKNLKYSKEKVSGETISYTQSLAEESRMEESRMTDEESRMTDKELLNKIEKDKAKLEDEKKKLHEYREKYIEKNKKRISALELERDKCVDLLKNKTND